MQPASLQSVITSAIDLRLEDVYTAIPCVVVKVNSTSNLSVDVQPLIKQLFRDGTSIDRSPILNVPVMMPTTKQCGLTFPVVVGDTVMCVFSMKGLDNFKRSSITPTSPTDLRSFSTRDAVAIPGLFPFKKSPNNKANRTLPHNPNDVVVAHNLTEASENEIRLKEDGSIKITSKGSGVVINLSASGALTITANSVTVNGNTTINGNLTVDGTITGDSVVANGVVMETHRHAPGVTPPSNP